MNLALAADIESLTKLAYRREEWCASLVERYHALRRKPAHSDQPLLDQVYQWLFCPLALWAVNFHELISRTLNQIEGGARITNQLRLYQKLTAGDFPNCRELSLSRP